MLLGEKEERMKNEECYYIKCSEPIFLGLRRTVVLQFFDNEIRNLKSQFLLLDLSCSQ